MRSLGGKAAIEVMYGQVCVGSTDDVRGAFRLVDKLVDDYCAYGFETFSYGRMPDELIAKRNKKVATELTRYYQQTKRMLVENREFLEKLADALMEKKTLLQKDIQEIRATLENGNSGSC